jgi:excinuclease ABC subunit A
VGARGRPRRGRREQLPLTRLHPWLAALRDTGGPPPPATGAPTRRSPRQERGIAESILKELDARVGFLDDVGLGYLTLDRQTRTLSGGEAQRITLANSLGSRLVDTLYVLDEPTIGLHPADNDRLLRLLVRLREHGNTVLVVEHDPDAMRLADWLVELGPGSGERGGELVFQGTLRGAAARRHPHRPLPLGARGDPRSRAAAARAGPRVRLEGAREHNLRATGWRSRTGALTVVTGVSGSGKSTLVHDVLYRALERELSGGETSAKRHLGEAVGAFDRISGAGLLREVVLVDQSPIGRTPRSNPVTYIKAWDEVRRIYSSLPEARKRGFGPGHFSFNVAGGRCEACKGEGQVQVEMVFMADVFVPCEVCGGARFKPEVLEVRYRKASVADVLEMTIDEAIRFFLQEDRLGQALWHLQQVGLGYLRLGQPAPTLSGGEAQRIKIARELAQGARQGRQEALHPRRAHHGPASRRHQEAPAGVGRPGGRRPHGAADRAQPGRDQDRRLDRGPGPRRRARRRPRGGDGHPRGGRGGGGERDRQVAASAAGAGAAIACRVAP